MRVLGRERVRDAEHGQPDERAAEHRERVEAAAVRPEAARGHEQDERVDDAPRDAQRRGCAFRPRAMREGADSLTGELAEADQLHAELLEATRERGIGEHGELDGAPVAHARA